MFLHADADENTFLGPLRHRVIEPDEFGVADAPLNTGASVQTRQVATAGFAHHQICFQLNGNTNTVGVQIALAAFVGNGGFISNEQTGFILIRNVNATNFATRFYSVYWGLALNLTCTTIGSLRFSGAVVFRFVNNSGSNRIISAWLESIG